MTAAYSEAWAAGLFEGEGSLSVAFTVGGRPKVKLALSMTDRDVLERFGRVVGGSVKGPYERPNRRPMFGWWLHGFEHLRRIYAMFGPYLGERRSSRFEQLLALEPINRGGHYQRDKTHCKHGHEFTPENTYRRRGRPGRECRACVLQRMRERYSQPALPKVERELLP